ncbi:MAG: hypothetical protein J6U04_05070 [Salinivirgaceae bacterium]|nr:hypothetical protein [Salinivirgaceae bacterium]
MFQKWNVEADLFLLLYHITNVRSRAVYAKKHISSSCFNDVCHVNDYRNTVVAEMMKTLNYVNMFNHGVRDVQALLKENNNPAADFNVSYVTAFSVIVKDGETPNYSPTVHQLFTNLSVQDKQLIISLKESQLSASELQQFTNCSPQSKQLFIKQYITPNLDNGIIAMTHPESSHHPRQKYYLTETGKKILEMIQNE